MNISELLANFHQKTGCHRAMSVVAFNSSLVVNRVMLRRIVARLAGQAGRRRSKIAAAAVKQTETTAVFQKVVISSALHMPWSTSNNSGRATDRNAIATAATRRTDRRIGVLLLDPLPHSSRRDAAGQLAQPSM